MFDTRTFQAVVSMASDRPPHLSRIGKGSLSLTRLYFKLAVDGLMEAPTEPVAITPREREILSWAAVGKSRWEIAAILSILKGTERTHRESIHRKLDVSTTTHAITKAIRQHLISP